MSNDTSIRESVAKVLSWGDAHVDFDRAVAGIPAALRGVRPKGWEYSAWQLVEHIRIAQADILEFCLSRRYKEKAWPDDYWPSSPLPPVGAWTRSLSAYRRDRAKLQRLARNTRLDLTAAIPHGSGQTYLREILLVADHTAYHVGQLVALRRQLGNWS